MPINCGTRASDRRERARQLVAEGRLGGAQPGRAGGHAKAARLSEHLQEAASRNAALIEKALTDSLRHGTRSQKLKAAEVFSRLALQAENQQSSEHRHESEHLDRAELIARLSRSLTQGPAADLVQSHLAERRRNGAVDAEGFEIVPD